MTTLQQSVLQTCAGKAYLARCAAEQKEPITHLPPAMAPSVDRFDRNTVATAWHGVKVADLDIPAQPEGVTNPDAPYLPPSPRTAAPEPKRRQPTYRGKPAVPERLRSVKAGSARAKILTMMDGTKTPAEIDAEVKAGSSCMAHASCTQRDCGIGYDFDPEGRIRAIFPPGVALEDVVK